MEWVLEKIKLCRAGRFLLKNQLVSRTWGNLSIMVDDDTFIVSPSGKSYMETEASDIATVNIKTLEFQGNCKPSSEMGAHGAIYSSDVGAFACIHTHQRFATAISVLATCYLDSKIDEKDSVIEKEIVKHIPQDMVDSFVPYGMAGSVELVNNIKKTIAKVKNNKNLFIILANHGVICWGKTIEEAIAVSLKLEKRCEDICKKLGSVYQQWQVSPSKLAGLSYEEIKKCLTDDTFIYRIENCPYINEGKKYICYANQPEVLSVTDDFLEGYIDDFGQIVGPFIKIEKDGTIKLEAQNLDDLNAMYEITGKNSLSWQIAKKFGAKPIDIEKLNKMREKYVNYYSKLI